jgi:beta-galactosidase GanA
MHNGLPAIVESRVGKGQVIVFGTDPGTEVMKKLVLKYTDKIGIEPLAKGDRGVLVVPRKGVDDDFLMVINLENQERTIELNEPEWHNMMNNTDYESATLVLNPYEVLICRPSTAQSRNNTGP